MKYEEERGTALVDRLTHKAYIINMNGESFRSGRQQFEEERGTPFFFKYCFLIKSGILLN
jgi:hypothetical protein